MTYFERFNYNHTYENNWSALLDAQIFVKALIVCRHVCIALLVGGASMVIASLLLLQNIH
jgi:hypothetical protein